MSHQYYTRKEKKKRIVGNPPSLHCGHHPSQKELVETIQT